MYYWLFALMVTLCFRHWEKMIFDGVGLVVVNSCRSLSLKSNAQ